MFSIDGLLGRYVTSAKPAIVRQPSVSATVSRRPHEQSPSSALAALRAHPGPAIIDLDETLYLRNSTEDFLDCARPALLALLLLRLLDVLRPWTLSGHNTRDTWRVCAISIFFPWTIWRWRRNTTACAEAYVNRDIVSALKERCGSQVIILTNGFQSIVAPLLDAMHIGPTSLISCRMLSFGDRRRGKLNLATRSIGANTIANALVLTDSISDLDLLQRCAVPLLTCWPSSQFRTALSSVYLPGQYISYIKHPGSRYIFRAVLQEDFAFWILSSICLAVHPVVHIISLLFLLISFWAIYERGYVDNDLIAHKHEADPKLTEEFGHIQVGDSGPQPWVWSLLAGAVGIIALHPDKLFVIFWGRWLAVIIITYGCFLLFNRVDKKTRVWLYPQLQLARVAAFAVVVPIDLSAVSALGAHCLSRWAAYIVYRNAAGQWPHINVEFVRLLAFAILSLLIAAASGFSMLSTRTAAALFLWNVFRARHDMSAIFKSAHLINRPTKATSE